MQDPGAESNVPHGSVPEGLFRQSVRVGRVCTLAVAGLALGLLLACGAEPGVDAGPAPEPAAATSAPAAEATSAPTAEVGERRTERVAGLTFEVPAPWSSRPPRSSMRLAEFAVPGPAGEADLTVFRFPGGGGTAQANVARWVGQFEQPDGVPSMDRAVVEAAEQGGLTLTRVDISGRYEGTQMPGAPAQPPLEDGRLLALIVEGSGDPYFFKLQGPAPTVATWVEAWKALTQSVAAE